MMHSNCPYIVVGELMVPTIPSSDQAGHVRRTLTRSRLPSSFRYESATFVTNIVTNVTCNEVKVLKNGLNFTSLKVKVFPFFITSLKVKVLKLLLKYSNALLILRYCTTLHNAYHDPNQPSLPYK